MVLKCKILRRYEFRYAIISLYELYQIIIFSK